MPSSPAASRIVAPSLVSTKTRTYLVPFEQLDPRKPPGRPAEQVGREVVHVDDVTVQSSLTDDVGQFGDVARPGVVLEGVLGSTGEVDLAMAHPGGPQVSRQRQHILRPLPQRRDVHNRLDQTGQGSRDVLEALCGHTQGGPRRLTRRSSWPSMSTNPAAVGGGAAA